MAGESEEGLLQRCGVCALLQARDGVAREEFSAIEDRDAIGEKLDFLERVRGKEQSGVAGFQHTVLEKAAKLGGGNGIQAARGFIEEEDAGMVQKGAGQAETLNGSGGERAHLAIQGFRERELHGKLRDARRSLRRRQMIEPAEEEQIFASGEAGIETQIAAGVESETSPDRARLAPDVVTGKARGAVCGKEQRRQDAEQGGLARAIRAEQSNTFPWSGFQRNAGKSWDRRLFERLKQSAPAAASRWKGFLQRTDENGRRGHREVIACLAARDNPGTQRREAAGIRARIGAAGRYIPPAESVEGGFEFKRGRTDGLVRGAGKCAAACAGAFSG